MYEVIGTRASRALSVLRMPEERRSPAIKVSMKWEYSRNIARLSDAPQGPFLMGAEMTISDMLLAHCLRWSEVAKLPRAFRLKPEALS